MTETGFASNDKIVRAYVVFQDRRQAAGYWNFYTRPGFRHCWVILPAYLERPGLMADQFSMKHEPLANYIDMELWAAPPADVARSFAPHVTAIVSVKLRLPPRQPYIGRGLYTCVTSCKAVLGLREWKVWTPHHLFEYLLRECNGVVEHPTAEEIENVGTVSSDLRKAERP